MEHMDGLAYRQCLGNAFIRGNGLTKKNLGARNIYVLLRTPVAGIEELKSSRSAPYGAPLE